MAKRRTELTLLLPEPLQLLHQVLLLLHADVSLLLQLLPLLQDLNTHKDGQSGSPPSQPRSHPPERRRHLLFLALVVLLL